MCYFTSKCKHILHINKLYKSQGVHGFRNKTRLSVLTELLSGIIIEQTLMCFLLFSQATQISELSVMNEQMHLQQ